jgi:hypothetical protein
MSGPASRPLEVIEPCRVCVTQTTKCSMKMCKERPDSNTNTPRRRGMPGASIKGVCVLHEHTHVLGCRCCEPCRGLLHHLLTQDCALGEAPSRRPHFT